MSSNADALVEEAIRTYRAGNKVEARRLLEKATDMDQMNEKAWMWLSAVVDTPEDQRICLENVLFINPNNQNAKRGLQMLDEQPSAPAVPPQQPEDYSVPTSSASASYNAGGEIGRDELDDWVQGLNLGGNSTPEPAQQPPFQENTFDDDLIADAFGLGFDDDESEEIDDLRSQFGMDEAPAEFRGPFTAEPVEEFDAEEFTAPEPAPVAATSPPLFTDDDEDEDDLKDEVDYFAMIPPQIKATRLPGTDDPNPLPYVAGVVVLLLLNIGAVLLLGL